MDQEDPKMSKNTSHMNINILYIKIGVFGVKDSISGVKIHFIAPKLFTGGVAGGPQPPLEFKIQNFS